ncbi:MAG: hypothetical protein AAFR61_14890 [Bacteroidota bacterium]
MSLRLIPLLLFGCLPALIFSQSATSFDPYQLPSGSFAFGLEMGSAGSSARDPNSGEQITLGRNLYSPSIGFSPLRNLTVRALGEWGHSFGFDPPLPTDQGLGYGLRLGLNGWNKPLYPAADHASNGRRSLEYQAFLFFRHMWVNRMLSDSGFVYQDGLQTQRFAIGLGLSFRVWKELHLEFGYQAGNWRGPQENSGWRLVGHTGLQYYLRPQNHRYLSHRNKVRAGRVKKARTKHYEVEGESRPLILGTALTFIPDVGDTYRQYEWTLNLNVLYPLGKRWYLGTHFMGTRIWPDQGSAANYYHLGPVAQWNLWSEKRLRVFLETGFFVSNLCTCGNNYFYREFPVYRLGMGAGWNIQLNRWLALDMAFNNYHPLNRSPELFNFTQYILGLDVFIAR